MGKCEIVDSKKFEGRVYYKVKNGEKDFIFRKVQDDDFEIVNYNEFSKIFEEKKDNKLKTVIKSALMPIILTTMITSSLSGCSKKSDNKVEPTKIENNVDDNNDFNNEIPINYFNPMKIEDLKKYGVKCTKITDYCSTINAAIYEVDNLDFSKLPDNEIFYYTNGINYNKSYNFDLDENVTWDDCINEVNKKDIKDEYKKIFINAIQKYKTLGLEKGLPIFYDNIKNSDFINDLSHPSAEFSSKNHTLTIGDVDIEDNPIFYKSAQALVDSGFLTKEEFDLLLTQHEYILTHELGHVISCYHDSKTGKDMSNTCYYAFVDKETNEIFGIADMGLCLEEGLADYLTYEATGRKSTKLYGYPLNQCIYLAYKEMLNIDSIEELRTLDTNKLIGKLKKIGISNAADLVVISEDPVRSDYSALYSPEVFDSKEKTNNTDIVLYIFEEYIESQLLNGKSNEEIKGVLDKIIEDYKERITTREINGELCIEGTMGYNYLSITELEEYVKQLVPNKQLYLK